MSAVGAEASDVGLIVQGTLIFLSAVVGVCGYLVQARTRQRQYIRETQVTYLRHVIDEIIGPAQSLGSCAKKMRAEFYKSVVYRDRPSMTYKDHVNDIFGEGALRLIIDGQINEYRRFVSAETEAQMTADPNCFVAKQYRRFMRIFVAEYHRPLANLLKMKHCSLPLPSREEFKRRFPGHKSGTLRKTFWLWQTAWTAEMEDILRQWDNGVFELWFPVITPFPTHLTSLNTGIMNDVKNEIERLTKGGLAHKDKRSMKEQTALNLKALKAEQERKDKAEKDKAEKDKAEKQKTTEQQEENKVIAVGQSSKYVAAPDTSGHTYS